MVTNLDMIELREQIKNKWVSYINKLNDNPSYIEWNTILSHMEGFIQGLESVKNSLEKFSDMWELEHIIDLLKDELYHLV